MAAEGGTRRRTAEGRRSEWDSVSALVTASGGGNRGSNQAMQAARSTEPNLRTRLRRLLHGRRDQPDRLGDGCRPAATVGVQRLKPRA